MKTLEITPAAPGLAEAIAMMKDEPLVLVRDGQPLAVLLPTAGADLETVSLSLNPRFRALLEESRRRQDAEGGISPREMRRRLKVEPARPATSERKTRNKRA